MTDLSDMPANRFLTQPLGMLYLQTAAPIILVMAMNGLLTVVDAYFLGTFVGAQALAAVTLMFPAYMLMVALSTLVANGMASVLARQLGAGAHHDARSSLVSAHGLSIILCFVLIALFLALGKTATGAISDGSTEIAGMGYTYISILVFCSPLAFFLSVNFDALRCEGKMGFIAALSIMVSLANIGFDYLLIGLFGLGVAGSALGTVLAQSLAFSGVVAFRIAGDTHLSFAKLPFRQFTGRWHEFLSLGAPSSLNFVGLALGSGTIIFALRLWESADAQATVAAYGIMTRIMTFVYLPMLGINMATQAIAGNNFGARLWRRSDMSLMFALAASLAYCAAVQAGLVLTRREIGLVFVDDAATAREVSRILPVMTAMLFAAGPTMVLASYFQAIGDAPRAAILGLARTYAFAIPLTLILPFALGEPGIWLAGPIAEVLMVAVGGAVLYQAWTVTRHRWGVFRHLTGAVAES
jgi:putative MATE family efflux protein